MTKLTRQHFKVIADSLRNAKPYDPAELQTWKRTVRSVANACSNTNSNFKRDKFYEACDYQ